MNKELVEKILQNRYGEEAVSLTWADFIKALKAGYGWQVPAIPQFVAKIIEKLSIDPNTEVEVEVKDSTSGWGTSFKYWHEWTVRSPAIHRGMISYTDPSVGIWSIFSDDGELSIITRR